MTVAFAFGLIETSAFEVGGDLSADIVSLPSLPSLSHEKLSDDSSPNKQSVKLAALNVQYNIGIDAAPASKPTTSKKISDDGQSSA